MACKRVDSKVARSLMSTIDSFMFDCDGVLWTPGPQAVPGAAKALQHLRDSGKNVFFVTNNSTKTRHDMVEKCRSYGFQVHENEVMCTAWMAAKYVKSVRKLKGKVYLVGGKAMETHFAEEGIDFFGPGEESYGPPIYADYLLTELDPDVSAVVVGFDPYVNFMKILKACSYLKRPEVEFYATNLDSFMPSNTPIRIPGTGSIVESVAYAACRRPICIGKPGTLAVDLLRVNHPTIDAKRTLMVGDRLDSDIQFGRNCGFLTMLTETGAHSMDDATAKMETASDGDESAVPHYVIDSVGSLLTLLQIE